MFCTQCGHQLGTNDHFCAKCGLPTGPAGSSFEARAFASENSDSGMIPALGRARMKWWGYLPPVKANLPQPYLWLRKEITLTVFENHLTVTPGAERRSEAADFATGGGMPLVTLVVGSVRSVKDKVATALGTPDSASIQQSFAAGELLWCRKTGAEVWEYQQKKFFGLKTPCKHALHCQLVSPSTVVPFLFPLDRTQETFFDPVNAIGCPVKVRASGIKEDDMVAAYADAFRSFFSSSSDGDGAF